MLLPKLSEISGDLKAINSRIDALENNMNTRIDSVEVQIVSLRNEMNSKFMSIEEITFLKIKIADIEKRLAAA